MSLIELGKPKERVKIDRNAFVSYYRHLIFELATPETIWKDISMCGEFIVDAQDMLDKLEYVDQSLTNGKGEVQSNLCDFIYIQPQENGE